MFVTALSTHQKKPFFFHFPYETVLTQFWRFSQKMYLQQKITAAFLQILKIKGLITAKNNTFLIKDKVYWLKCVYMNYLTIQKHTDLLEAFDMCKITICKQGSKPTTSNMTVFIKHVHLKIPWKFICHTITHMFYFTFPYFVTFKWCLKKNIEN